MKRALQQRVMKRFIITVVVFSCVVSRILVAAAPQAAPARAKKKVDPVVEQRHQDAAFAVLMESYRCLQAHRIEADYTVRARAANALTDTGAREQAVQDAQQERDLRLARLETEVANIVNSYQTARAMDESDKLASSNAR